MSDFKEYFGIVTTGFTAALGAVGWLYKDWKGRKQTETTYLSAIIERLRIENEDLKKLNAELFERDKEQRAREVEYQKQYTECIEKIHGLEIRIKEQDNQIQLLKLQKL